MVLGRDSLAELLNEVYNNNRVTDRELLNLYVTKFDYSKGGAPETVHVMGLYNLNHFYDCEWLVGLERDIVETFIEDVLNDCPAELTLDDDYGILVQYIHSEEFEKSLLDDLIK